MGPRTVSEALLELVDGLRARVDALDRGPEKGPGLLASTVEGMGLAVEELRVTEEALVAQQAELQLAQHARRSQDRWRAMLWEALPVPVLLTDAAGVLVGGNGEATVLLGVDADALRRAPLAEYLPLADRRALRDALSDVARGVPTVRVAVRLGAPGRPGHLVTLLGLPELPGDGDPAGRVRWVALPATPAAPPPQEDSATDWLSATATLLDAGSTARDAGHLLRRIAVQVTGVIPGSDGAVLSFGPPGEATAFAAHGIIARTGDGAQATAGEGPTFAAYRTRRPCHTADLRADPRWPRLARLADRGGAREVLAVPIAVPDGALIGVLTVYAGAAGALDRRAVELSDWLSAVVATLLRATEEREHLLTVAEQLNLALATRSLIEQARGIVMATCVVDAEAALGMLRQVSSRGNQRMVEVARQVIESKGRSIA